MKPKLLNVVTDFLPFGYGEQAALLAEPWSADCDVRFFSTGMEGLEWLPAGWGTWRHDRVKFHRRNWPSAAWKLRERIRLDGIELVLAWGADATWLVGWALGVGRLGGGLPRTAIPWVARFHRDAPPPWPAEWLMRGGCQRRPTCTLIDGAVPGAAEDPLTVPLHSFATFDARDTLPVASVPNLRRKFGWDAAAPVVGVVSPLEVRRGIKHFVWAADLVHWVREIRLVIWGSGSQQTDLTRYARQIASGDHYGWLSPTSPIRQQLLELDVLWDSNRWGLSPAGETALAQGIPVVTFADEASLAHLRPEPLLERVPWGARDELARATIRLLNEPARPRRFQPSPETTRTSIAAAYRALFQQLR